MEEGVFVGREAELVRATSAIDRAFEGKPAILLIAGEAGIGKTCIADVIARKAADRGARVVWGRAWEAGGAPPYWPFVQVFRALDLDDPFSSEDTKKLDVAHARFKTFDRAVSALKKEANETLLAIVLDDLHAADLPTLEVLHLLARDARSAKLLVIGTYRDAEARTSGAGKVLARVAREGETIALPRLTQEDVTRWMKEVAPEAKAADVARIYETTEGNALFVREVLRVRGSGVIGTTLPDGLSEMLDEHVARASPETRDILAIASVLGREIDRERVAFLTERDVDTVERALREGVTLGILQPIAKGERATFAHILLCDRLRATLAPSKCAALHWRLGEHLLASRGDIATAAHHLFEGRSAGERERASAVCFEAARSAFARLALEGAARFCERAREAHEADDVATCEKELLLGEAWIRAGDTERGSAACVSAAARAKRIGSAEHLARAALVYGTEIVTGRIDPKMLSLLEDAMGALPEEDGILRAKLLVRHGSALVPPRDKHDAMTAKDEAERAVAMARRIGDEETLLYTLHFGASAFGYLVSSKERFETTRELVELTKKLDRPLTYLAVGGWWFAELIENGRRADALRELATYERIAAELPQPHYQWRIPMMHSVVALFDGDVAESKRLARAAFELAERGGLMGGVLTFIMHCVSVASMCDEPAAIREHEEMIRSVLSKMGQPGAIGFKAWLEAATGHPDEAATVLDRICAMLESFPWWILGSEAACMTNDRDHAALLYEAAEEHATTRPFFWGPFGSIVFGPSRRVSGDLARLLGKSDEARRWYEAALLDAERLGARIMIDVVKKRLAELGTAAPPSKRSTTDASAPKDIQLVREGEMWRVSSSTGVTMHLKDGKGLHYLAELLARPNTEVHVTQLAELDGASNDAPPVLDERAKSAYRKRVEELEDILEEATRLGDQGRIEKARSELDAIAGQLASAVGLGGRDRKMGSQVEKARINVQRRLRDAIQRIGEHDPALGRYLTATVKTGVFCAFSPF